MCSLIFMYSLRGFDHEGAEPAEGLLLVPAALAQTILCL